LRTFDIVFVPGLRPKPPHAAYRKELLRCIEFGLQQHAPEAAQALRAAPESFRLYAWTETIYGEHRDIALDRPGIGALLASPQPDAAQRRAIESVTRRIEQAAHRVGDRIPLLGRLFASQRQRIMLSEARDYLRNRRGIALQVRAGLRQLLEKAHSGQRNLIVIGHSLGSVIAYDTLWEMSESSSLQVELFVTIGSPLGTRFVRRLIKGLGEPPATRYPRNISRWTNIAAKGELTALYPKFRSLFAPMVELGLLESLEDHVDVYNHFFGANGLNVHSEYGYVIRPEFAAALATAMQAGQSS